MLDLNSLDLDEIAEALADRTDYEHLWLIDARTGDIAFWTSDTGIDGHTPLDLEDLELLPMEPLPSHVWYRDMTDFAEGISDERAGRRLARAIEGGAPSAGSRTSYTRGTRSCYPRGTPSAIPVPSAARSNGSWTTHSSTTTVQTTSLPEHPEPDLP